jgi:HEAT repeat protein
LASAFWAAEEAAQSHEYFHHALSNFYWMPEKAVPAFVDAVRVTHGEVSRWSAQAFWADGWKETWVAPLLELLHHPDSEVRQWAAGAFGDVGDTRTKWGSISGGNIVEVHASGLPSQQAQAASRALVDLAMKDLEVNVRAEALRALGSIGPLPEPAFRALFEVMDGHPDESVRSKAAYALQSLQLDAAVSALTESIGRKDLDRPVRMAAIGALGAIGPGAETAVPALVRLLIDDDLRIPWKAKDALCQIGQWATQAVPVLIGALKDANINIRGRAATLLGELGPDAWPAIPALKLVLADENPHVRSHAERALRAIESKEPSK